MRIFIFRETEIPDLNPETALNLGMGATETCVTSLAQELSERHKVVVCCPCSRHKVYGKVEYIPFQNYGQVLVNLGFFKPDVFIVAGNPSILFKVPNPPYKTVFWQHNHPHEMTRFNLESLGIPLILPSPEAAQYCGGVYGRPVHGIYNGIREVFFKDSPKIKGKIVYSGSLSRAKGLYNLLEKCGYFGEYDIHICGSFNMYGWEDTEYRDACMKLVKNNVVFEGSLSPKQLAIQLASAELCISNPIIGNNETCCMSALEAMAAGTPVIAGSSPIMDPIISHGGIPYKGDLVAEVQNLMGNKEKREKFAYSGRKWAEGLKWAKICPKWEELLNGVLREEG